MWQAQKGEGRGEGEGEKRESKGSVWACASQIVHIFNVVVTSKAKNITEPLENLSLV